jgi:hypothetical protein
MLKEIYAEVVQPMLPSYRTLAVNDYNKTIIKRYSVLGIQEEALAVSAIGYA